MSRRHVAALQALFVTFLWSTSWVLIKTGLDEIPALTFAGLRYVLATLVLLPFALRRATVHRVRTLPRSCWLRLVALGLVMYAVTQGAQFLALSYLPAQTTSLILSFSPVVVALLSAALLAESVGTAQWVGVVLYLVGAATFLYPADLPHDVLLGMGIAVVCLVGNAGAAVLGRSVNRSGVVSPLTVTVISMGIGALALLISGLVTQGLPGLSVTSWLIVGWLAMVNTAFAFVLWNHTLRILSAVESSVVNNTMLLQIAILAWVFLDEDLGLKEILGLLVAASGALMVQLKWRRRRER